jgi:nicotinate phosphoribosyltransferase
MNIYSQRPLFNQALIVDLYELTMAAGYFTNNYNPLSTFELFIREMPEKRSFLVTAGLEQVIEYLLNLKFTNEEITYLKNLQVFKEINPDFWEYLSELKFSGDLWAIPEGQIVFAGEPLLRVTAPIIEAQIVETFLLSSINFQTLIASKAARVVMAAHSDGQERMVMEFGSRRAHGPEASVLAARASFVGGCSGTSNVLAGMRFHIPVFGTAAHSWTMAFPTEIESFKAYLRVFPKSTILLIDTYDTEEGTRNAIKLGPDIRGVRIDSGDLGQESKKVRQMLDDAGLKHVKIIASGDLNEYKISKLVQEGAPIDMFGVGTQLATSSDAPALGGIYKLVEQEINQQIYYRAKFSENKATYPGKKQIYRLINNDGNFLKDIVGMEDDHITQNHLALLIKIIEKGELKFKIPDLETFQKSFKKNLKHLPRIYQNLDNPTYYPIEYSSKLKKLFQELKEEI